VLEIQGELAVAQTSVTLNRIDPAPIEYLDLPEVYKRWLADLVDNINYNSGLIEGAVSAINARLVAGGL
jgi:hypothetical protein